MINFFYAVLCTSMFSQKVLFHLNDCPGLEYYLLLNLNLCVTKPDLQSFFSVIILCNN